MKTLLASVAGFVMLTGVAAAQGIEINPQGPLDVDGDGFLTEEEFAPIRDFGAQFVAYDSDGDGLLSKPEYNEGVRNLVDTGNTNDIGPEEQARIDELTRMFSNELADRDNLLNFFAQRRTIDDTQTGAIAVDGTPGVEDSSADDAN